MSLKRLIFVCTCLLYLNNITAQVGNDNCSDASQIVIPSSGFAFGTFSSSTVDISSATIQPGETFAKAIDVVGLNKKSMWYKFSLPTTRSVRVILSQPGSAIANEDAGFAVYKTNSCLPVEASISSKFTPIAKFSSTFHPCVEAGDYLIQVSSKLAANGPLSIQVEITDATGALYDHPKDPYDFGKLTAGTSKIDYSVNCQSIEDAAEICTSLSNYQQYIKSTWHTFTTPAYFDYLSVLIASPTGNFTSGKAVFGYNLYQGNSKTDASLKLIDGCDSLSTNGNIPDQKSYRCDELLPNTTYTIQLFYHQNFVSDIRLAITNGGSKATQAPVPILSQIPATNSLGVLPYSPVGITTNKSDYFGCNSRHSLHPCEPSLPAKGIKYQGLNYNLSSFFTFTLTTTSKINISGNNTQCGPGMYFRLFNQNLTNDCSGLDTSKIILQFLNAGGLDCVSPGTYTLQVLGKDSMLPLSNFNYGTIGSTSPLCLFSNLGQQFNLSIRVASQKTKNLFSLENTTAFNAINNVAGQMQALQTGISYKAVSDTFGCEKTILPAGIKCVTGADRAMFREFTIGDGNKDGQADSGTITLGLSPYFNGIYTGYNLYSGDASQLAKTQNKYSYPDSIMGLLPYSLCRNYSSCGGDKICVVPGTYTLVTFGNAAHIGGPDAPTMQFDLLTTQHYNETRPQNLGSIIDTVTLRGGASIVSDGDYFSCRDNAVPINGYTPCTISGKPATKAIYRQFYLSDPALLTITGNRNSACGFGPGGIMTLFSGKGSDGLNGLTPVGGVWSCFTTASNPDKCKPLPAGWYTVVSYGSGPSYSDPLQNVNQNGYGSYVGILDQFTISVTKACEGPKYNRPYKAAVDSVTKAPFLIEWAPRKGSTTAYPITDTTYRLYKESFNCTIDTPFNKHPIFSCSPALNRVAYYVFKTTQESYLQINTFNFWASVYQGDVRKDSLSFSNASQIQPCVQSTGYIQLCKLPAGTYTLVVFAGDINSCSSVTPTIYIDNIGFSRFDNANNAYDFGLVPADSLFHNGKTGDVNPLNPARAPSNDFFYCTTGARNTDPVDAACQSTYNPNIYKPGVYYHYDGVVTSATTISRRNLWYSFVADQGGYVRIRVDNKTPDKPYQYQFAVYRSNVDGKLPFSTVVNSGQVDSTLLQGLTLIKTNQNGNYCGGLNEISFYREPCASVTERYYIIVDNRNPWGSGDVHAMNPVSQVEVSILVDSINAIPTKFDHYFQASNMGNLGAGTFTGQTDNYTCATADATDPIVNNKNCAVKTLWYKFTATVTGHIQYRIAVNGVRSSASQDIQLFRQDKPGDSTLAGLTYIQTASFYDGSSYWSQNCISPGIYYFVLPGCNRVGENVFPEIKILEEAGDFCSAPAVATVSGSGTKKSSVIVDCHTIGTDYGEFNPTLSCPANAPRNNYKSSWFRIDVTGLDTMDVTVFLSENTNALPADIQYRMMTGNCNAMQEQSCVQDAQTQNTYKCLAPGSYFIQVFTPVMKNSNAVTGSIDLNLSSVKHADTCAPLKKCLINVNFSTLFNCNTDSAVRFINYSTYGSAIKYRWDFGINGESSEAVSPSFVFPALNVAKMYNVKLVAENTSCGEKDSSVVAVTIPARPYVRLGNDVKLCTSGSSVKLDATSYAGATYRWHDGSTGPVYTASVLGTRLYSVAVTFNGCTSRDTVSVFINPIAKAATRNLVICVPGDSVLLSVNKGYGETYSWSNGETRSSVYAKTSGIYWADITYNGCTTRDSFNVVSVGNARPLGNDTLICSNALPYRVDVSLAGATSYLWQDGTRQAQNMLKTPGSYWVNIAIGGCTIRDTLLLRVDTVKNIARSALVCFGENYLLPSGKIATKAGKYTDTLRSVSGCDSIIATTLSIRPLISSKVGAAICIGQSYTLPSGRVVHESGVYFDTLRSVTGCDSAIATTLSVSSSLSSITNASICKGASYTLPSGQVVNSTGNYEVTLKTIAGCDSVVTVKLIVLDVLETSVNITLCAGESYKRPGGGIANQSGIYQDTVRSVGGCDSIITSQLEIRSYIGSEISVTACAGIGYLLPSGKRVFVAGNYADTLRSVSGCDSIVISKIAFLERIVLSNSASICQGASYQLPSGVFVRTSGNYSDTLKTSGGCDSIVNIALTVLPPITKVMQASICAGQDYTLPSGRVVRNSGEYIDTLRSVLGCDSVIRTSLDIRKPYIIKIDTSICQGKLFKLPSGLLASRPGIYSDTLRSLTGCDSIIIIDLSVQQLAVTRVQAEVCAGEWYSLPSGRKVQDSGLYIDTITKTGDCDEIIQTTLLIKERLQINVSAIICSGQKFALPSGRVVTSAGTYVDTLRSAGGCDSIIRTTLSVSPGVYSNFSAAICKGSTYQLPGGRVVANSGTYVDTIRSVSGCDSIVTIQLTVRNPTSLKTSALICTGESYQLPWGKVVSVSGNYQDTLKSIAGCDSMYRLVALTVSPRPVVTVSKSNDISCLQSSATLNAVGGLRYLWWPSAGLSSTTVRNPVASPSVTTVYHVQATSIYGCVAFDSVMVKVGMEANENAFQMPNAFSPNGDGSNDCFGVRSWGAVSDLDFKVFNRWGQVVFSSRDYKSCWDGRFNGQEQPAGGYVYVVSGKTVCGMVTRRGTVMLVR